MKKSILVLAAAVLLVAGAVGLLSRIRGVDHRATQTLWELQSLALALKQYCTDRAELPFDPRENSRIAEDIYRNLQASSELSYLNIKPSTLARYRQHGRFVDLWGQPVQVGVETSGTIRSEGGALCDVYSVRLWSVGPDLKNEGGGGDDIAFGPVQVFGRQKPTTPTLQKQTGVAP